MKKQILSEEFKKMQKLAGIITENQNNYPKGFNPYTPTQDDNESYDGEVVAAYTAPTDGWDENNSDTVVIVKKEDGFYVDGYISFGDFDIKGPFKTQQEAEDEAYDIMEDIVFNWDNDEDDEDEDDDDDF